MFSYSSKHCTSKFSWCKPNYINMLFCRSDYIIDSQWELSLKYFFTEILISLKKTQCFGFCKWNLATRFLLSYQKTSFTTSWKHLHKESIVSVTMFILQSFLAQSFFRTLPSDSFWGSNYVNLFLKLCFVSISWWKIKVLKETKIMQKCRYSRCIILISG